MAEKGFYGEVTKGRKLWKDILKEGMEKGGVPVPVRKQVPIEDARWQPRFTTRTPYKFATQVKYRDMYWKTHGGENPEVFQAQGLNTREDWMRATNPDLFGDEAGEGELPFGAVSRDKYGNPWYGGDSHHEEFVARTRAQIEEERKGGKEGGWSPNWRLESPERLFAKGQEGEDVDPNSLQGIYIAGKDILTNQMLGNVAEAFGAAKSWAFGEIADHDPDEYAKLQNWYLDEVQSEYSEKVGAGNYYFAGHRISPLHIISEDGLREAVSLVEVASMRLATGKSTDQLTAELASRNTALDLTPAQEKYAKFVMGASGPDKLSMVSQDRWLWWDTLKKWATSTDARKELYAEADLAAEVMYGSAWDGITAEWTAGKQAMGGGPYVATTNNTFKMAEFMAYMKEHPGADAYRSARDFNNPIGEMVGRAINDPWNILTFGTVRVGKAMSIYKVIQQNNVMDIFKFMDAAEEIGGLRGAVRSAKNIYKNGKWAGAVDEAVKVGAYMDDAGNLDRVSEAVQLAQKATRAVFDVARVQESRPYMWWKTLVSPSTSARVHHMAADMMHGVNWVARTVARTSLGEIDIDDYMDLLKNVGKLASPDTKVVREALEFLGKRGNITSLLSERGMRGVMGLSEVLDDMPYLQRTLAHNTKDLSGMELMAELVKLTDEHAYRISEKLFPTLRDIKKAKGKLPFGLRAVEKVDTFFTDYPGKWMRGFFGTTQLGLNPGYAVRNTVQNLVQSIFDEGIGVLSAHKVDKANEMFGWMGIERTAEGFMESTPLAKGSRMDILVQNYNKKITSMSRFDTKRFIGIKGKDWRDISAQSERWTTQAIYNKAIPFAMEQMLNKNVSRHLQKVIARLDPELAVDLERILIRNQGDVVKTMDELEDWINTGIRKVLGSENLPKPLRSKMHKFVGEARWKRIVEESETAEEAVTRLRKWQDEMKANVTDDLKREVIVPIQDGPSGDVPDSHTFGQVGDAVTENEMSFDMGQEYLSFYNANTRVGDEIDSVLRELHVNFELGIGPKSTAATRKAFLDSAETVQLKMPEYFGGQTITGRQFYKDRTFGKYYPQGVAKLDNQYSGLIQRADAANTSEELDEIWELGGLVDRHGLRGEWNKHDVRTKLIDEVFKRKQEFAQQWRDANYLLTTQFVDEMGVAGIQKGIKMPPTDLAMQNVRQSLDLAHKFDKHLPLRWVEKDIKFANQLIKRGEVARGYKAKVLAWARQYGYPTAVTTTAGGVAKLDNYIVNVFNKYMGTDLQNLDNLTRLELDELQDTLLLHSVGLAQEAIDDPAGVTELLTKILDTGEELGYDASLMKNHMLDVLEQIDPELRKKYGFAIFQHNQAKEAGDTTESVKILQGITDEVTEAFRSVVELPSIDEMVGMDADELTELIKQVQKFDKDLGADLGRNIFGKRSWVESNADDIEDMAISGKEVQKASRIATEKKVQEMDEAVQAAYDNVKFKMDEYRIQKPEQVDKDMIEAVVSGKNIEKPPKVYGGETAPMGARVMQENMDGIDGMVDQLDEFLKSNWNEVQTKDFTNKQPMIDALPEIRKTLDTMVDQSRVVARDYAEMTANFVLHDYTDQKNFDLLLAYIYPYSYWYTRTYANWMQRILRNPGAVQAYYDYKRALAEKNKDLPEWMRHYVNVSGLFGLETDNPLFSNIEAWVMPLDKIINPDFNDADKRSTQFGRALDNLGKFGPSTHQAYSIIFGAIRFAAGEREEGGKHMGRVTGNISRFIRAGQEALGVKGPEGFEGGIEVDPLLIITALAEGREWWQGMDAYEQNRVARSVMGMVERGQMSEDEAIDMFELDNPWDNDNYQLAVAYARSKRTSGDLFSYAGSPSFRTRTQEDIEADAMDLERRRIFQMRDSMDEEAWAAEWTAFNQKFPYADIMSIARGSADERDTMLTYHVMRRIPAGLKRQYYEMAGLDPDTIQDFYDTKGENLEAMNEHQREEFMTGIITLSMTLATPDDATAQEWKTAGKSYAHIVETLEKNYGEDVMQMEDLYWMYMRDGNREDAYALTDSSPELQSMLNDRTMMLNNDPLLRKYYATYGAGKSLYNSMKYDALAKQFPNIEVEQQAYFDARAQDPKAKASDRLKEYWTQKGVLDEHYNNLLLSYGQTLPEGQEINFRTDFPEEDLTKKGKELIESALEYDKQGVPEYMNWEWKDWMSQMSPALQRVVSDWAYRGAELNDSAEQSLEYAFEDYDIPLPMMRDLMRQALEREGAEFYSEDNPPSEYGGP